MNKNNLLLTVLASVVLFSACKKDDTISRDIPKVTTGLYIMNEGNFGANNCTISYYNFGTNTATTDFYKTVNGSGLGDTGNDLLIYGGKIYIVMNVSSYVQVADAFTATAIRRIEFAVTNGGVKRQPRYAVAYKNKVLVSSYDGTVAVIDTNSLTVDKFITVGSNPNGMVVSGDKLYVSNSGGLNLVMDSTLSVIDLTTMTETRKIVVGLNPESVAADNAGNVYVACTGDYSLVGPKLVKVNTTTNTIVKSADTAVGKVRFYDGLLYATGGYLGSSKARTLSTTDFAQTRANFVTDGTTITNPYGLNIDEATGDVYITDAKNFSSSGEVFCFDKTGKKKFSFSVAPGVNPNTVAIIKK